MSEAFPYRTIDAPRSAGSTKRPIPAAQRASILDTARAILRWQRSLDGWQKPGRAPDATPFVSIYAAGKLRGCFGSDEGKPGERLARAFLLALDDVRFGGIAPEERAGLAAQVSYFYDEKRIDPANVELELEAGAQGLLLLRDEGSPVVLLPQIARDHGLDARAFFETFTRKVDSPVESWRKGRLFVFRTDEVVARANDRAEKAGEEGEEPVDPLAHAAAWLARLVGDDGSITFAIDPRARTRRAIGELHHGRVAMVLRALAAHGGFDRVVKRGRQRLARDLQGALAGETVAGFPTDPGLIGATLAFAILAGVDVKGALSSFLEAPAHADAIVRAPWQASQIATALGNETPPAIWQACIAALDVQPWAPWTMLAARARQDAAIIARCTPPLVESIRSKPPYEGAILADVPELALTALVVEALAPSEAARVRRVVSKARAFLQRWQNVGDALSPSIDAELALGAFPISPIEPRLRADVTAHALLSLHEADV